GSGSGYNAGRGIAVDAAGSAYVTGETQSSNFPTTPGAFQPANAGLHGNAFVTKLNPAGSALVYSTYLGGSFYDFGTRIAVDAGGGYVTKLDPTGSALVYSTYLNGGGGDAVAVDAHGSAYVTGSAGAGFVTTAEAFQTSFAGGHNDAFVVKLDPTGSALVYST